jgi:hypothetical protein
MKIATTTKKQHHHFHQHQHQHQHQHHQQHHEHQLTLHQTIPIIVRASIGICLIHIVIFITGEAFFRFVVS